MTNNEHYQFVLAVLTYEDAKKKLAGALEDLALANNYTESKADDELTEMEKAQLNAMRASAELTKLACEETMQRCQEILQLEEENEVKSEN